mgnify:CR=1 FL=1
MLELNSTLIYYSDYYDIVYQTDKPLSYYIINYFNIKNHVNKDYVNDEYINVSHKKLEENIDVVSYLIYVIEKGIPDYSYNVFLQKNTQIKNPFSLRKDNDVSPINIIINETIYNIVKENVKSQKLNIKLKNDNYKFVINKLFNFLVSIKKYNIKQLLSNIFEFLFNFTILEPNLDLYNFTKQDIKDKNKIESIKKNLNLLLSILLIKKINKNNKKILNFIEPEKIYTQKFIPQYVKLFKIQENITHAEFLFFSKFVVYFIHYFFYKKLRLFIERFGLDEKNNTFNHPLIFSTIENFNQELKIISICSILINELIYIHNVLFIQHIKDKLQLKEYNFLSNNKNLPILLIYKDALTSLYSIFVEMQKENNKNIDKNNISETYDNFLLNEFLRNHKK